MKHVYDAEAKGGEKDTQLQADTELNQANLDSKVGSFGPSRHLS